MILKLAHQPNHSQQNRFLIQNMATQEPNKASESKSKMFHQMTDTKTECFNHDPSAQESNKHKTHCEYPDSGWIFFCLFKIISLIPKFIRASNPWWETPVPRQQE